MVLVAKPMFCCMGNHLGLYSEASDRPEGHKKGGVAEVGQEASEHARDMGLVAKPMCWGMRNHLGLFSEASDRPEGQELGGGAVGGQGGLQEVKSLQNNSVRGF